MVDNDLFASSSGSGTGDNTPLPKDTTPSSGSIEESMSSRSSGASLLVVALGNKPNSGLQFPVFTFKLERTNYSIWCANVLDALDAFEMKDHVLLDSSPPKVTLVLTTTDSQATMATNPKFLEWKQRDKFILIWIRTTISAGPLGYITRTESSFQAWQTIERMFQTQSRARSMHLKQQLNSL